MVTAYSPCQLRLEVENNLLSRQAAPMLLTNGGTASRELYSPGFLSTVTCILNMAVSTSPMGMALVTMRTRFAGLHRPDSTDIYRDKRLLAAPQEVESEPEDCNDELASLEKQLTVLKSARLNKGI